MSSVKFPCPHCLKSFSTAANANRHIGTHLKDNLNSKSFHCDFENCKKSFYTKGSLHDHKYRTHTCPNRFSCDFKNCVAIFKNKSALKAHKIKHTGVKSFKCREEIIPLWDLYAGMFYASSFKPAYSTCSH